MRIRIALELAIHMDMYLDNNFLQLGHHVGDDLPKQYAMYSEQYLDQVFTPVAIKRILSRETEQISKLGSYKGMWQIRALASVFKCKACSIYPKVGGFAVRRHLNRWVCPKTSAPNEPPPVSPHWLSCGPQPSASSKHQISGKWITLWSVCLAGILFICVYYEFFMRCGIHNTINMNVCKYVCNTCIIRKICKVVNCSSLDTWLFYENSGHMAPNGMSTNWWKLLLN